MSAIYKAVSLQRLNRFLIPVISDSVIVICFSQKRLNHLLILNVHKERTDKLDLKDTLNEFVKGSQRRAGLFSLFSFVILLLQFIVLNSCYCVMNIIKFAEPLL